MDGVLVDSEIYIREASVRMFRDIGYDVKHEDFLPFTGMGEDRFIGGVAEKYNVPLDIGEAKAKTYLIYEQICSGELKVLPGVFEALKICRERGLKTAVATSADEIKMLINLKEIGLPVGEFDATVFGEMVRNKKPDPEIYLCAAELLGTQSGECLVVEDAPSGIRAAVAAGMRSLALSTSFGPEKLKAADWIIPDLGSFSREHIDW